MEHVPLGPLSVSRVGVGCNNFGGRLDFERTRGVVDAALDAGVDFFDTADIYGARSGPVVYGNAGGSERSLGQLLRGRRDRVVLATSSATTWGRGRAAGCSALCPGGARGIARTPADGSCRSPLLPLARRDNANLGDRRAMAALVQEGKARAIGVSNVTLVELEEAAQSAQVASVQNEYSLLAREAEHDVLPCCRELGIGFVPYYPLAAGLLTVKYRRGKPPPRGTRWAGSDVFAGDGWVTRQVSTAQATFDMVARLETFARARGRTLLELAIAGVASRPGVASVIAGATSPGQVRAGQWQLLPHELAELRSLVG